MAATPSVRITKTLSWNGTVRRWSNRYHFNGGVPADDAHWHTFMDAIVAAESACLANWIEIVEAVGYPASSDIGVATKTYTTVGALTKGSNGESAGEVAQLIRWPTTARSSKNHPVYLFSYFHSPIMDPTDGDKAATGQHAAYATYAAQWVTGFSDGTNTYVRAGPNGATGGTPYVAPYVTHRDFPR